MSSLPVEDGEILEYLEELSEISSDDEEFEKLREQKKNLEFENFWMSANCGKENKKVKNTTTHQPKRQRLTSTSRSYEYSTRDVRRHSRAPSVFNRTRPQQIIRSRPSTNSLYKARKHNSVSSSSSSTHKIRRKRKEKEKKRNSIPTEVSSIDITGIDEIKSSSEDDEELELRLELLTSTLNDLDDSVEVDNSAKVDDSAELEEVVIKKPDQFVRGQPTEEEELRILALKSAMLKSHERRKNRQKLENERPYSPSDNVITLPPITIDIDSFMEISPIVSPNEDINNVDVTDPIDMEISNSPIHYTEYIDDDIKVVPMEDNIYPQESIKKIEEVEEVENDEEFTLRTMLLSSISIKKPKEEDKQQDYQEPEYKPQTKAFLNSDEETLPGITKNLKLALERLKMKHRLNTTKKQEQIFIKENARSKLSAIVNNAPEQKISKPDVKLPDVNLVLNPIIATANPCVSTVVNPIINSTDNRPPKPSLKSRVLKVVPGVVVNNPKIEINSEVPRNLNLIETNPMISPSITDTKYIPRKSNFKQSKLITSLKDVIKPVPKLIITLNALSESESDVEIKRKSPSKKSPRRIVRAPGSKTVGTKALPEFEKNLDSFLKNIRSKQESRKTSSPTKSTLNTTKPSSAVKHLPVAQQQEYEKLLNKIKMLEESKRNKQKLRQLKRIKSITEETPTNSSDPQPPVAKVQKDSAITEILVLNPPPIASISKEESNEETNKKKISLYLSKISNLAEPVQKRLLDKSESNYRNHSQQLMEQINNNIELLNTNEIEVQKQLKLRNQVQELEQMIKTYKDKLQQANEKIKLNYPKIIRSQRDLIQSKSQQQRFSVLCEQVGKTVQGQTYKLPDRQCLQMVDNLKKIAEKNKNILKSTNNAQVCSHIRFLSAKVQQYITEGTLIEDKDIVNNEATNCEVQEITNQENNVDIPLTQPKPVECLKVVQEEEDKSIKSPDKSAVNAIINNVNELSAKDQIAVVNSAIVNNNVEPKLPDTFTVVPITINLCDTVPTDEVIIKDVCCIKHKMSRPETDVYLKKLKYDSPLGLLKKAGHFSRADE